MKSLAISTGVAGISMDVITLEKPGTVVLSFAKPVKAISTRLQQIVDVKRMLLRKGKSKICSNSNFPNANAHPDKKNPLSIYLVQKVLTCIYSSSCNCFGLMLSWLFYWVLRLYSTIFYLQSYPVDIHILFIITLYSCFPPRFLLYT